MELELGLDLAFFFIGLIVILILLYRRKRENSNLGDRDQMIEMPSGKDSRERGELSSNALGGLSQLETTEQAVELPAEHLNHDEIGRAIWRTYRARISVRDILRHNLAPASWEVAERDCQNTSLARF